MMRYQAWLLVILAAIGGASTAVADAVGAPVFSASAWEAADRLFRGDDQWAGGDGAYSIDLGAGRVLWLFGDSFIDPTGARSRTSPEATMISNTLAVQRGYDPSRARIRFFWGHDETGRPRAFFPDAGEHRFWPGHGLMVQDRLVLFLMKVRTVSTGLGFEVFGWSAVAVGNPQADPDLWELEWLDTPGNADQVIIGSAGILSGEAFVYAFASKEPDGHGAYLVRWPRDRFVDGRLHSPAWWNPDGDWSGRPTAPTLTGAPTEFTVHRDGGLYLQFQTRGFGAAAIVMRTAEAIVGPWSPARIVYQPPEMRRSEVLIYQGKAHPHLTGADLVLTYATNHSDFSGLVADETLYFPRFVRLTRVRNANQ